MLCATSLAWPDPIFACRRYRFQYKRPTQKGSGIVRIGYLFLTPAVLRLVG